MSELAVCEEEEQEAADLVVVGVWSSLAEARDHALVVLAMHLECWIFEQDGCFEIHAERERCGEIRAEFALYGIEQAARREWVEPPVFPAGVEQALGWVAVLLASFWWQGRESGLSEAFCNSSRGLVEGREWWRPLTALFLHADIGHLLGNLAMGGIFGVMVAQSVGAWRGWALILAAGTFGNALNAWLRFPVDFQSLGASTAIFGAVGVLSGAACLRAWRDRSARELRPVLVPLIAGMIVLAWYGTGGGPEDPGWARTDVAGHFAGWLCGLLLAWIPGFGVSARREPRGQA
ncbi:MAG: rhomboid family intramembrane serine protease [Verrucomicrobia bacterium]|nr:MAG: rhomboid family intramembrane serine protease [Verrucomicrobiota bacterium]TAE88836.1 MAG: rhomboid family intramembrane serine protease [Verrucomicrobiota bacterium]TAF27253.1 MAG: rhomboid family intramembrane serine protease [Verrucomicrobiota bacterium]TAF42456.1 MAG: rhomboid family intramembrane serine protease [Verrucomicrobiota bacterium]